MTFNVLDVLKRYWKGMLAITLVIIVGIVGVYLSYPDQPYNIDGRSDLSDGQQRVLDVQIQKCGQIFDNLDASNPDVLRGWSIETCETKGCSVTIPGFSTIRFYVEDSNTLRHEVTHACLNETGFSTDETKQHRWMWEHDMCYGSTAPGCKETVDVPYQE